MTICREDSFLLLLSVILRYMENNDILINKYFMTFCHEVKRNFGYATNGVNSFALSFPSAGKVKEAIESGYQITDNYGAHFTTEIEDYYIDGSIEKVYVVDNFALEDRATGDISYTSSTTSTNTTKYNIAARQTLYFTCKYYGSGVPVFDDIFVHATKIESYVNFSSTSVAFFQHGIIAQLFLNSAYPDIYNIQTVRTPVNNKSYYVYANESNYYKVYGAGQYASIMSVRTANKNEFELRIDILSILDGV